MPITDETLDRLSDELRAMAAEINPQDHFNSDNRSAAFDLIGTLNELALHRPTLALFADLLSRHDTRDSALTELTSRALTPAN